jgi:sugar phosphate isomerase/epimerase
MSLPVAVQLYSLREQINEQGAEAVLKRVADMGYGLVESFGGLDAPAVARACADLGLEVVAAHLASPLGDNQATTLETAAVYGLKRIIEPYRPPEAFKTADDIKRVADFLNEAAKVAGANGLDYFYHNHWWEYATLDDGQKANEVLLAHISPEVKLEIDVYWVQVGGQDPVGVVQAAGARAPLLHIKDGPANREDPMTAAGDGVLDIAGIVAAGAGHTQYLIVELDRSATDMFECVEKSLNYLKEKGLGHGR